MTKTNLAILLLAAALIAPQSILLAEDTSTAGASPSAAAPATPKHQHGKGHRKHKKTTASTDTSGTAPASK